MFKLVLLLWVCCVLRPIYVQLWAWIFSLYWFYPSIWIKFFLQYILYTHWIWYQSISLEIKTRTLLSAFSGSWWRLKVEPSFLPSSPKTRNQGQNLDDPLYMQTLDNPDMVLVTILLTNKNFLTWSWSIQRALTAKNKLGFINGTLCQPANEPERSKWRHANEMVSSWVINSMKEIAKIFVYCTLARKLLIDLDE